MRYRYSHRETMRRHGIQYCPECLGDGWITRGHDYWTAHAAECPSCDGTGVYREEATGINWKRISTHTERIAA